MSPPKSDPLPSAVQPVAARAASRPLWLPGSTAPKHLDGSMPGDYGFDPLNLGEDKDALAWYQQAEIIHARFAMAAVAGILIPGAVIPGFAQWYEAGSCCECQGSTVACF